MDNIHCIRFKAHPQKVILLRFSGNEFELTIAQFVVFLDNKGT